MTAIQSSNLDISKAQEAIPTNKTPQGTHSQKNNQNKKRTPAESALGTFQKLSNVQNQSNPLTALPALKPTNTSSKEVLATSQTGINTLLGNTKTEESSPSSKETDLEQKVKELEKKISDLSKEITQYEDVNQKLQETTKEFDNKLNQMRETIQLLIKEFQRLVNNKSQKTFSESTVESILKNMSVKLSSIAKLMNIDPPQLKIEHPPQDNIGQATIESVRQIQDNILLCKQDIQTKLSANQQITDCDKENLSKLANKYKMIHEEITATIELLQQEIKKTTRDTIPKSDLETLSLATGILTVQETETSLKNLEKKHKDYIARLKDLYIRLLNVEELISQSILHVYCNGREKTPDNLIECTGGKLINISKIENTDIKHNTTIAILEKTKTTTVNLSSNMRDERKKPTAEVLTKIDYEARYKTKFAHLTEIKRVWDQYEQDVEEYIKELTSEVQSKESADNIPECYLEQIAKIQGTTRENICNDIVGFKKEHIERVNQLNSLTSTYNKIKENLESMRKETNRTYDAIESNGYRTETGYNTIGTASPAVEALFNKKPSPEPVENAKSVTE